MHLGRGPSEDINTDLQDYYTKLLSIINKLSLYQATWRLIKSDSVNCVTYEWTGNDSRSILIVNYSPEQTHATLYPAEYTTELKEFVDEMTGNKFTMTKISIDEDALECDLDPWQVRLLTQNQDSHII